MVHHLLIKDKLKYLIENDHKNEKIFVIGDLRNLGFNEAEKKKINQVNEKDSTLIISIDQVHLDVKSQAELIEKIQSEVSGEKKKIIIIPYRYAEKAEGTFFFTSHIALSQDLDSFEKIRLNFFMKEEAADERRVIIFYDPGMAKKENTSSFKMPVGTVNKEVNKL